MKAWVIWCCISPSSTLRRIDYLFEVLQGIQKKYGFSRFGLHDYGVAIQFFSSNSLWIMLVSSLPLDNLSLLFCWPCCPRALDSSFGISLPNTYHQCVCLTNFIWRSTSNPKCHVTILFYFEWMSIDVYVLF